MIIRSITEGPDDQNYNPFIDGEFDRLEFTNVLDGYLRQKEKAAFCHDSRYERE